jgi:hypothetical protein
VLVRSGVCTTWRVRARAVACVQVHARRARIRGRAGGAVRPADLADDAVVQRLGVTHVQRSTCRCAADNMQRATMQYDATCNNQTVQLTTDRRRLVRW